MNHCVYRIDPLQDPRWPALVEKHPKSSVFHSKGWLQALRRTYGYDFVAFTTSSPMGALKNAIVFAQLRGWINGRRIVSLPFSDHCEPLFDSPEELQFVLGYLRAEMDHRQWRYIECRPANGSSSFDAERCEFQPADSYFLHRICLKQDLEELFRSLDPESVQQSICQARNLSIRTECGRSGALLGAFFHLLLLTGKRHHSPPQPRAWFRNILDCLGQDATIRVAFTQDRTPIASILTLRFKDSLVYRYGATDKRFGSIDAKPLLLWEALEDAKLHGAVTFDLGRSASENTGLVTFKNNWSNEKNRLTYWRYPAVRPSPSGKGLGVKMAERFLARLPTRLLAATDRAFHKRLE